MELDFRKVDKALRRAREAFMENTMDAIGKSDADYEQQAVYRAFAETICVSYETYAIRELGCEFGTKKEDA